MIAIQTTAAAPKRAVRAVREADLPTRMAEAMREMSFAGQTIDADSIALRGFTAAEIEKYGREARDLATAMSVRRVA